MAFGNDEQFEIIVQRRGPDVRTAIYATQSVDILKGKFSWKVPENMIEGLYFIRVRVALFLMETSCSQTRNNTGTKTWI